MAWRGGWVEVGVSLITSFYEDGVELDGCD